MTVNLLLRAVESIKLWREREKSIRELSRLDDKTLRDIGVDRHEIRLVVENLSKSQNRTRRLDGECQVEDLRTEYGT